MSKLINECPICTEEFTNSDNIYSTSCGHIFHHPCMVQWQRNSLNCPQCRLNNPTVHKLYLTFDDNISEYQEKIKEFELKLKSSIEENNLLLDQNKVIQYEFLQVQKQYTDIEQEKMILEEKIRQMNDSEQNFLDLQKQFTESTEFIKYLQLENKDLLVKNENLTKELTLKSLHIETMENNSAVAQNNIKSDNIDCGKIKILEQKFNYIMSELEKEISNNTKLSIENLKLQSYIDVMKSKEETGKTLWKGANSNLLENRNEATKTNSLKSNSKDKQNNSATKIIIKNIPKNLLTVPLANVIVNLASKMNFTVSPDDIVQVKMTNDDKQISSTGVLMVEFKNKQLRNEFISNKNILKNDPSTKSIVIGDYMDDKMNSLLMYTREMLRNNGYNHVFYKNNQIFAKKHRSHPKVIRIYDKAHVDTLRNRNQSLEMDKKDTVVINESNVE